MYRKSLNEHPIIDLFQHSIDLLDMRTLTISEKINHLIREDNSADLYLDETLVRESRDGSKNWQMPVFGKLI